MTDPFSDARSEFLRLEDLLGRLVLVVPKELIEAESQLPGANGKKYEKVIGDTIILDGDPTESIETIPFTAEDMHWSGVAIVSQLKGKIKTNGMVLGRVGKQPSKTKGFGPAWILTSPTDEDKVLARPAARTYLATINDPFASATTEE